MQTFFNRRSLIALSALLLSPVAHAVGPALLDNGTEQAATTVRIEAESAFAAPFVEINNDPAAAAASGGAYVAVPDGSGAQAGQPTSGSDYGFQLVAGGDIALWARVWTPDAGSDAFWFRYDSAGPWTSWEPGIHSGWSWRRIAITQLEAGPHLLNFAHQDDGARVDTLLFTSDLNLVPGNALAFSGDTGANRHHVEIPDAIVATDELTVEAWVNLDASPAGNSDPIIAKGGEWGLLRYQATNKLVFRTGGDELVSLSELVPGTWYHIAATLGGGTKRLYINGVLNRSHSGVGDLAPGPAELRFGANVSDISAVYRGQLDEVRVWSVERSVAEIVAHQDAILEVDELGLEGYWRFDATGLTATDSSAAGRDGTLTGFSGSEPLRIDGPAMTGPSQAIWFGGRRSFLDVVVGNYNQANRFHLNNGSADPFAGVAGSDISADTSSTESLALGDVDGDGDLDLVAGNVGHPNRLYLNNGSADPFAGVAGSDISADTPNTDSLALGDVDGDGDLDLVAGSFSEPNRLYLNNGSADPFAGVAGSDISADTPNTISLALGDVDGDGDLDLVAGNFSYPNRLYLNNGSADPFAGVAGSDISEYTGSARSLALGDVDGDGDLDLVAANLGEANLLYLNNGSADPFAGVAGSDISADRNTTRSLALGDVDGDGDLDLVAGNENQTNRHYLNNGSADPFAGVAGTDLSADTDKTFSVALGDVDGDGDLDLVAGNAVQTNRLYLNNGSADPFAGVAGSDLTADTNATYAVALGDVAAVRTLQFLSGNPAVESQFDFTDSLTVETWLRFEVAPSERVPLVAKGTASSWGVYLTPVGKIAFETPGSEPPGSEPVVINLGGINYRITTVSTTYDASAALLMSNPWWGDSALATTAANLLGTSLGLPNSNPPFADIGPVLTYQVTSNPPIGDFGDSIQSRALAASPSGSGLSVSGRSDPTDGTFAFAVATPEPVDILRSDAVLVPGEWHHVAVTLQPLGGGLLRKVIYIDGGIDASKDDVPSSSTTNDDPVIVGGDGAIALSGALDEIRIWDRALAPETIAAQHVRNLNGREPGLVQLWRLDVAEPLARNSALNGPTSADFDGTLEGGLREDDYIPGVVLGPPLAPQFSLFYDGTEYVEIPDDASLDFDPDLTLEVWVRPTEQQPMTIVVKGSAGYGLGLDVNLRPVFFEGADLAHSVSASATIPLDEWTHLAVVVREAPGGGPNGRTTFYINGQEAGTHATGVIVNNAESLFVGKGGVVFPENFVGEIDELRLWGAAVSPAQIEILAQVPLPDGGAGLPDLAAYWAFDEGTGSISTDLTTGTLAGSLNNMDESNWHFGHHFGVPGPPAGLNLSVFPDAHGLWIGQVTLNRVNEAAAIDPESLTPTGDSASVRIVLHVDDAGRVRLLKDVVIMKQLDDPNDPESATSIVLVTDPSLIPNYEGVVQRDGKVVGLRYGSAAYDFNGLDLPLLGGLGPSLGCAGTIRLASDHPTNPYRHKFHPRHQSGYALTRAIGIQWDGGPGDPLTAAPGYGVNRITGTYTETVTGLHKLPIRVQGSIELSRISEVGTLNN